MSESPDFGQQRDFYTFAPGALGEALPEFEVVRLIGKGSMGLVYEARRRSDGERIALKVLPPSLTLTEATLARFLREGRLMARIEHPDIVRFLDQGNGTASGVRLYWFAMEFVEGVTLQERLQIGPMPVQRACAICARIGRALQYAHEHGVVHRDVKPGNVMLRDDDSTTDDGQAPRIAITDFGLARETGTGTMTESGAIVGTPMYMAPELVLGGNSKASTLADVYSLGATLYTVLTGQPPFDGPTAQSVLKAILEHEPKRPSRLRGDLPKPVEAIVACAMAKDPRRRYGSPLELAEDLERFLRGQRVAARMPGPAILAWRYSRRHPLVATLGVCAVLLAAAGLVLGRERHDRLLEQGLAEASNWLARAAATVDDLGQPLTSAHRRAHLLAAISATDDVLEHDDGFALAWFVRAKAHHRLRHFDEAILDLDMAERVLGKPTPEILHFRIDALRQRGDRASMRRVQQDLTQLLQLDSGSLTRAMATEHLIELAEQAEGIEREDALLAARQILEPVSDQDTRAAVLRARILETSGAYDEALAAMRIASRMHEGNVYVHLQAARMYDRLGLPIDARRELNTARLLGTQDQGEAPEVDLGGLDDFLGDIDRLLRALDQPSQSSKD